MDARTPKGRGKRGRTTAHSTLNDLSNFTETRSSVHSKLRSNNTNLPKGRRGPGAASPTPFATPKTDVTPGKRKTKTAEEEQPAPKRKAPPSQPTSPLPPPTLLECPEPNCSKKYKHINGLKYHQSHAHGSPDDDETKESATSEEEEPSPMPEASKKEELCEMVSQNTDEILPEVEEQKPIRKYPEEPSPLEPSPPVLANAAPPLIIPTTPPPPAPSPPPPPAEDNSNINILSQPPVLTKVPQFKVKPASALMSEEKKPSVSTPSNIPKQPSPSITQKKKSRKSSTGSPDSTLPSPPGYEELEAGREEVQSPAYSDISDDAAPLLESEVEGKAKPSDKKEESPQLQHFGMYPYYGQPPYLVPSVSDKPKDPVPEKTENKVIEKEKKEPSQDYQQKMLPQHYYQYGYHVPGFSYNMDSYPVVVDEKKEEKPPATANSKTANNSTLHIPNPAKPKIDPVMTKEKHQNDNHQILKESIDMKNQVNPGFLYHRQPNRPQEEVAGYYAIYPDRKDSGATKATPPPPKSLPSPSQKHKEKQEEKKERREEEKKQEGVKPTMETQGPPPPPTSQYAYIHPGYMQSPHYGTLPFEPAVYRGMNPMLVSGYPNSHYLHPHPQLHAVPRYAPEDLSRSQSGKALDLLQHHASQYYAPSHKIHELQERAIKSPTPKTTTATPSPSAVSGPASTPVTSSAAVQVQGKSNVTDAKDARSPPPQRHVHTHHHTHVGLGYPILAGQYAAPYGGKDMID